MLPEEIQKILDKQGLELIEILQRPDTPRRRFFSLRVRPVEGSPVLGNLNSGDSAGLKGSGTPDLVLKVFGRGDPGVVLSFEKEVEFLRLVTELGSRGLKKRTPKFVARGGAGRPWYLREYIEGEFLGDICFDFGIKREFLTPALRDEFLSFFGSLREFSESLWGTRFFSSLSSHGYDWYKNDLDYYRRHIETISQKELSLIGEILEESRDFLDREARFLVHGDLYLKNMFWLSPREFHFGRKFGSRGWRAGTGEKGRLVISDWELLHRGNLVFDLGFVWALSFREPDWRFGLLEGFGDLLGLSLDAFRTLFRVVAVSVSLRFIRHSEIMLGCILSESQEKARENANEALESHQRTLRGVLFDKSFVF